jgi:hypothetical protein
MDLNHLYHCRKAPLLMAGHASSGTAGERGERRPGAA